MFDEVDGHSSGVEDIGEDVKPEVNSLSREYPGVTKENPEASGDVFKNEMFKVIVLTFLLADCWDPVSHSEHEVPSNPSSSLLQSLNSEI